MLLLNAHQISPMGLWAQAGVCAGRNLTPSLVLSSYLPGFRTEKREVAER